MKIHWYALELLALDYKIFIFQKKILVIANISHICYILNPRKIPLGQHFLVNSSKPTPRKVIMKGMNF
jgi:hypothetical protein